MQSTASDTGIPSRSRLARLGLALALVLFSALAFSTAAHADTFNNVTNGPGEAITGKIGGTPHSYTSAGQFIFTGTRPDGSTYAAKGYCIDISHRLDRTVVYHDGPPTSGPITWILNNTPSSPTDEQAAAIQAAIWHWSDNFTLDADSPSPAGHALYEQLIADSAGKSFPVPVLTIAASNPSVPVPGPSTVVATVTTADGTNFPDGTSVTFTVGSGGSFSSTLLVTSATRTTTAGRASVSVYASSPGTVSVSASVGVISGLELLPPSGAESQHLVLASPNTEIKGTTVDFTTATPSITTSPSAGGNVGTTVRDTAVVSGGFTPTGTVTFRLYGPGDTQCTSSPVFTDTQTISNGTATSAGFTPSTTGTYSWVAVYNGDNHNVSVTSPCTAELVTITAGAVQGISTTASPTPGAQAAVTSPVTPPVPATGMAQQQSPAGILVLLGLSLGGSVLYRRRTSH